MSSFFFSLLFLKGGGGGWNATVVLLLLFFSALVLCLFMSAFNILPVCRKKFEWHYAIFFFDLQDFDSHAKM